MITPHRALNAILVSIILGLYALMAYLDGPTDHQAQVDQLSDLQAAIKSEAAQARFTRAAAQMCGNADYELHSDNSVRCVPRKGHGQGIVIATAQVQP